MPNTEYPDIVGKFRFSIPLQIRFSDIDGYQHVNNGIYFNYFEHSRAAYLKEVCNWNVMEVGTVVARIGIDYLRPIHLTDSIRAYVKCTRIGNTSFELVQYILGNDQKNQEVVFAKSICVMVSVDMKSMKPVPIPTDYRMKLES